MLLALNVKMFLLCAKEILIVSFLIIVTSIFGSYTSNLKLDFDQVEVFSMLQQISFTSYGRDTFSSLSLLIDSIAIQQDSISKQTADFALVTFAQSLKLTENQKKELIELLNEKYMVSDIKSIDDILYRIKSAMYATNEDANYFKELDTLDSPQSMKLD